MQNAGYAFEGFCFDIKLLFVVIKIIIFGGGGG